MCIHTYVSYLTVLVYYPDRSARAAINRKGIIYLYIFMAIGEGIVAVLADTSICTRYRGCDGVTGQPEVSSVEESEAIWASRQQQQ